MEAGELPAQRVGREKGPMHSPVNWALLGLIIERPSYAYDLAQRFERRYGTVLALSNVGHVYTAIGALESRAMIEEIPGTRAGRQPKPRYQATPNGVTAYREWLVEQVSEDRRRGRLFVLALAALANNPHELAEIVERCERSWLTEGMGTSIAGGQSGAPDGAHALLARLIEEENRLAVGAKLTWAEYARQEIRQLGARRKDP